MIGASDPEARVRATASASGRVVVADMYGKAAQPAASQNGKVILCITSRVPMGGPTVQPMLRMV